MAKIIPVFILLFSLFSLASCGDDSGSAPADHTVS